MSQFRNKVEAQQAADDMEARSYRAEQYASREGNPNLRQDHLARAREYMTEHERIRALLPTLPD